jgi:cytochrome b pre-mRNA-processing protein 3
MPGCRASTIEAKFALHDESCQCREGRIVWYDYEAYSRISSLHGCDIAERGVWPLSGWSLKKLFGRSSLDVAVRGVYHVTVEQARQPGFYCDWHVPDSAIGRFDVIALHGFLVLHRFKREPSAERFAEAYCGVIFDDMDRNLREMGVGDLSVGKKVRKLAEGFYGRAAAYEKALEDEDGALQKVLVRNLYAEESPEPDALSEVANYVRRNVELLAKQDIELLTSGQIVFAPLEEAKL